MQLEIARKLKLLGTSFEDIAQATGLDFETIAGL